MEFTTKDFKNLDAVRHVEGTHAMHAVQIVYIKFTPYKKEAEFLVNYLIDSANYGGKVPIDPFVLKRAMRFLEKEKNKGTDE